jgi:hypothetical protein
MLQRNDSQRLSGKIMKDGRKYSESFVGMGMSRSADTPLSRKGRDVKARRTLNFTPLKSAALSGDIDTVVKYANKAQACPCVYIARCDGSLVINCGNIFGVCTP